MKFDFSEQETNIILQSLAKQPFEIVYQVIAKLQAQATEQVNKKEENDNDTGSTS